jgi:hypothetical protein
MKTAFLKTLLALSLSGVALSSPKTDCDIVLQAWLEMGGRLENQITNGCQLPGVQYVSSTLKVYSL